MPSCCLGVGMMRTIKMAFYVARSQRMVFFSENVHPLTRCISSLNLKLEQAVTEYE